MDKLGFDQQELWMGYIWVGPRVGEGQDGQWPETCPITRTDGSDDWWSRATSWFK